MASLPYSSVFSFLPFSHDFVCPLSKSNLLIILFLAFLVKSVEVAESTKDMFSLGLLTLDTGSSWLAQASHELAFPPTYKKLVMMKKRYLRLT